MTHRLNKKIFNHLAVLVMVSLTFMPVYPAFVVNIANAQEQEEVQEEVEEEENSVVGELIEANSENPDNLLEQLGNEGFLENLFGQMQEDEDDDEDDDEDEEEEEEDMDDDADDNGEDDNDNDELGPNGTPGPDNQIETTSEGEEEGEEDLISEEEITSLFDEYERPEHPDVVGGGGLPDDPNDLMDWWSSRREQAEINTSDDNAEGNTETATSSLTTTVENDVEGEDSVIGSTASTTEDVDIESDQYLDLDNVTTGESVTGSNLLHSDKDMFQGKITTGSADINSDTNVQGNTNAYETVYGGGGEWVQKSFGSEASNKHDGEDNILGADASETKSLTILNKNTAFVNNVKELLALSGNNRLSGAGRVDESGIFTGTARAKSSLLNIVNTNTVNSSFLPIDFNIFENFKGNINILELLFEAFGQDLKGPGAVTATAVNEDSGEDSLLRSRARASDEIDVTNENDAYIYNDLDIKAISGQNQILAGRKVKETQIKTGDVDIANNLINFLNTNLFESMIGVININVYASEWLGNLILPSAARFANSVADPTGVKADASVNVNNVDDSLNQALALANSDLSLVNESHGDVQTDINVSAKSGDNYAGFEKDAEDININSGDTVVRSSVLTLTNRDVVGASFSQGFFNVLGNWQGEVVGTPDSALRVGSDSSFIIADEDSALTGGGAVQANVHNELDGVEDSLDSAIAEVSREITVNNNNKGRVVNRLNILGVSGTNDVSAYKGDQIDIDTGDIRIANNVATYANNTFFASKGLIISLNVFNDWTGNIAYDEFKDLSVNVDLLSDPASLLPGSDVSYGVSVRNSGTESTDPGTMRFDYDPLKYELIEASGAVVSNATLSWPYEAFESAGFMERVVTLRLRSDLEADNYGVSVAGSIDSDDFNTSNNNDTESFTLSVSDTDDGLSGETDEDSGDDEDDATYNVATGGDGDDSNDGDSNGGGNTNSGNSNNGGSSGSSGSAYGGSGGGYEPASLVVRKTVGSPGPYQPGDTVSYQVVVRNPGTVPAHEVVVYDNISNGSIKASNSWPLDDVAPGEEVVIEYENVFTPEAMSGDYVNVAYASGFNSANEPLRSNDASTTVVLNNSNVPFVLSTSGSGGTINSDGDDLGVIDSFNQGSGSNGGSGSGVISPVGGDDQVRGTVVSNGELDNELVKNDSIRQVGLTLEEEKEIEHEFENQIENSTSINRQVIPVAQAAEFLRYGLAGDMEPKVSGASSTRLAVYPAFLEFDGLDKTEHESYQAGGSRSLFTYWSFWIILLVVLVISYILYKDRQRKSLRYNSRF